VAFFRFIIIHICSNTRKRSRRFIARMPMAVHTSGMFGLSRLFVAFSPVTTAQPSTTARPMTKGSAADLFFLVSTSFSWSFRIADTAS